MKDTRSQLSERFDCHHEDINQISSADFDVVICTISQDIEINLPQNPSKNCTALDLRYGKETNFLRNAKEKGYQVSDGLSMLIYQALAQFELFTGVKTCKEDAALLHSLLTNGK